MEMREAFADLAAVVHRWRIWFLMGQQDIFMRYRRSALGPFWITLTMCVFVLALAYVYSAILNQPFRKYVTFLAAGVFVWTMITSFVNEGANMIAENEYVLGNAPVPLPILAGRLVYRNVIIFGHNLLAVLIMLALFGAPMSWTMFAALPGLALLILFGLFVALLLGPACARFRDVPQILANLMQVLFFITPIMWMPSMASERGVLIAGNPFYHMIELIRAPLLGALPTPTNWAMVAGFTALIGAVAFPFLGWARRRVYLWL